MKILFLGGNRYKKTYNPLKKNYNIKIVKLRKNGKRRNIIFIIKDLIITFIKFNPDLLLTDNPGIPSFFLLLLKTICKKPLIIRLRGDFWTERKLEIKNSIYFKKILIYIRYLLAKLSFKYSEGIIPVSSYLKSIVHKKTNLSKNIVKVVNTPLEVIQKKTNRININSNKNNFILLTVTNFDFLGKADALCKAIKNLKTFLKNEQIIWKIAGEGKYLGKIKNTINILNLKDKILLLGYVEEINHLYEESDVFMYFSFQDAYPSVILEAQFFRLPVIANNFGGINNQITQNYDGFLINNIDNNELNTKIKYLFKNKTKRIKLGKNGYQKVITNNNLNNISRQFKKTISSILKKEGY